MALVLCILGRDSVDRQRGDLCASLGVRILTERSEHLDHVIAVINPVDEVLLLLALYLFGQLLDAFLDALHLSILGLVLLLKLLSLGQMILPQLLLNLLFRLHLLELSLAGLSFTELALGCKLLLLSFNLEFALLDRLKLVVGILDLSLNQRNLLFSMIHAVHLILQFYRKAMALLLEREL